MKHLSLLSSLLCAACALLPLPARGLAQEDGGTTPQLTSQYGMRWFKGDPPEGFYTNGAGLVSFPGGFATNCWDDPANALPTPAVTNLSVQTPDGSLRLLSFAYGQPVESDIAQYALGDVIPPPPGATAGVPLLFEPVQLGNNPNAYWRNASGSAIWLPSRGELVAAAGGNIEIGWPGLATVVSNAVTVTNVTTNSSAVVTTNVETHWVQTGEISNTVVYTVSSIPTNRPARIYWTEDPYNAPVVYMQANNQQVYATLHYNNYVPEPVVEVVTNWLGDTPTGVSTNHGDGIWLDGDGTSRCLRANGVEGILLLEYYADGKYEKSLGVQPVQVTPPTAEEISAHVGDRLLPRDRYYGTDDLIPKVTAGIGGGNADKLFMVDENSSYATKRNWLFALRATEGSPWDAEVYWEHKDERGVQWPFEQDWYDISWPTDIIRMAIDPDTKMPANMPSGMGVSIASQATPDDLKHESANAILGTSNSLTQLSFGAPGYVLMQYSTQDDMWYEAVLAVNDDNAAEFDQSVLDWDIGKEILPFAKENYVLVLSTTNDYAVGTQTEFSQDGRPFTIEAWASRMEDSNNEQPVMSFFLDADDKSADAWEMGFTNGVPYFMTSYGYVAATNIQRTGTNAWYHLAGVAAENGMFLYLDGQVVASNAVAPNVAGTKQRHIQIGRSLRTGCHFAGRIDEVRYWKEARSASDIAAWMRHGIKSAQTNLLECYPMDEGSGVHIKDVVDGSYGVVYGKEKWMASFHLADTNVADLLEYPGEIKSGTVYNVEAYNFPPNAEPDPLSAVFAVNTGQLWVYWSQPSKHNGKMPGQVYYPSDPLRYRAVWPADAPEIAVGSSAGSGAVDLSRPSLYVQNDATKDGYNPNEEHAVLLGNTVYALRDDLNTTNSSAPFVLVNTAAAAGRPGMQVFRVVRNLETEGTQAGAAVNPPMPLAELGVGSKSKLVSGPGWKDRKGSWWAKAAGDDGGSTNIVMQYYYRMQPGFFFPELAYTNQPAAGTELPWLPTKHVDGGTGGTPVNVVHDVVWPEDVPEMAVAQTLAEASGGLPDIWNQASVDILYQQSKANKHGDSVVLYDPAAAKTADLKQSVVDALVSAGKARKETTGNRYRFVNVSPFLEERLFYDPTRGANGQLVLEGMLRAPLAGAKYVSPNWLTPAERDDLLALSGDADWKKAVGKLPVANATVVDDKNPAYVNAALSSAPPKDKKAFGYVTLAFNQSTNTDRVPEGLPVSLQVLRVSTNLFASQYLDVVEPENPLEEKLTLVYPDDFGGKADLYEFDWRWNDPAAGREPSTPKEQWTPWFDTETCTSNGAVSVTIESGGGTSELFILSDHWFAVRYRRVNGEGPSGTNWSPWVSAFAEGWIERVMTAINPFEQRFKDMAQYAPGLAQTMLEQCGGPYEGAVALNADAVQDAGLIQVYQTVMDRALSLSLDAGTADPNCNDSLLFAATRLNKLYMILGNEAYADAQDPTIAVNPGTAAAGWYDSYEALDTSLFCFENQTASLLEEELALLRGRDDSGTTSVTLTPVYNRLMWNYTYGIDGGEVAYACNYNVHGDPTNTTGDISAEDAKRMYPQGHGDAWGHYLSALAPYYTLLSYTNFGWNTTPGATLVGNASVGVDYFDEESFAAAAAAKARTGADIVGLTARRDYAFGAAGLDRWTPDADTNRCWDVDGWAVRAGQGAYFDWAVANSLLLDTVTNRAQVGGDDAPASDLDAIDRDHAPSIGAISSSLDDIQVRLDRANAGLNPLGLAEGAIPFDISAAELDDGKGHFEQVYERALAALKNARTTFSAAQDASLALRKQYDSASEAVSAAKQEEIAFKNRLVEIYGYPYADDIGPSGTYAQDYDGPDLVNYMILDLDETYGPAPVSGVTTSATVQVLTFNTDSSAKYYDVNFWTNKYTAVSNDFTGAITQGTNGTWTITRSFNSLGLQDKPSKWKGRRRAQGEIQAALYDFVGAYYSFLKAKDELESRQAGLEDELTMFKIDAEVATRQLKLEDDITGSRYDLNAVKAAMELAYEYATTAADGAEMLAEGVHATIPKILAVVFPGTEVDSASLIKVSASIAWGVARLAALALKTASEGTIAGEENHILGLEKDISKNASLGELQKAAITLLGDAADQLALIRELQEQVTAMDAAMERVLTLQAEGERVAEDRAMARNRIAQQLEGARYADMLYRTFRNETLANYAGMFDLAARYAWQAAMAYDYETGLLDARSGKSAAARFLSKIVRARTLGRFADGVPQTAGAEGDGGLADALARLKADWDAVKPRYGINNPDSATTRFSLRKEFFRISSSNGCNQTWADALSAKRVDDLNEVDEYRRYCVPYGGASTNKEPGLVIRFSGSIVPRCNFFGHPAGGGDNFYDPTWLSTRIRAVGVWFGGYNTTWNTSTNSGPGLANTPNVYLVPAGTDTIVTGTDRTRTALRTWNVLDQVLPLPIDIGEAEASASGFSPLFDSLSGSAAERRRHPAFRAHHDAGNFTEAELCTNARLVGRSVWNSNWVLIIPGSSLLSNPDEGLERFIHGALQADGTRDGHGITDIRLYFQTYSYSGD